QRAISTSCTRACRLSEASSPSWSSGAKWRKLAIINAVRSGFVLALLLAALGRQIAAASAAEYCPDSQSEIQTDRPDVTNSSFVVPTGSLQAENGINLTARAASRSIDGTNTRIRLGVPIVLNSSSICPT